MGESLIQNSFQVLALHALSCNPELQFATAVDFCCALGMHMTWGSLHSAASWLHWQGKDWHGRSSI